MRALTVAAGGRTATVSRAVYLPAFGSVELDHLVVKPQDQERWRPLSNKIGCLRIPAIFNTRDPVIEPRAAHRNTSDGNLAVCCSMVLASLPSRWSVRGSVCGSSMTFMFM